jgi:hypothetical protein
VFWARNGASTKCKQSNTPAPFFLRALRAHARQSACMSLPAGPTHRSHILLYAGRMWAGARSTLPPVILFTHTQNEMHMSMYLTDRSHRTAGWVGGGTCTYMYVLQMCTARLCGSHKNHSPSRPVVNWRSLNLYIALLRSRLRGAAIADRRHEVGGVLSASAVSVTGSPILSVTGSHILRV